VVELLEGTLSQRKMEEVDAHLARCATCREQLAVLGRTDSQDDQVPTAPLGREAHLALEPGEKVGRFEVLGRIGSGGMGVVFSAFDRSLNRKVALKLLRSPKDSGLSVSDAQKRLMREAQAMAQISHPNVISVYDVGTYKSEVYIAMELVEGETLTRWLRRWQRPWQEILDKFLAAGSALAEAHAGGLAHRDFKPDNVLVGNDQRVRVMDFGLVRWLLIDGPPGDGAPGGEPRPSADLLGQPLTRTGTMMGTPRYMAPEQIAGQETEARSDQFSFCVALYEALYGRHPFEGDTAMGLTRDDGAPRPPPAGSDVPVWLHRALVRGLAFDAKDRFPTMQALLRALTPAPPRPSRLRPALALALTGIALIYAISAWVQARSEREQLGIEVGMARTRIVALEREVDALRRQVGQLQGHTGEQKAVIQELEQRLAAASAELARAQEVLAQEGAAGTPVLTQAGGPAPARPATPGPRPLSGLSAAELLTPLEPLRHDLAICFREWLERVPDTRLLLGVRLRIDATGVPGLGKIRGIEDQVMQECVTGNLLRLRFPARDAVTVADYKFLRAADGTLSTAADVAEILPPPTPEPAPAAARP
jgi:hypothetical protein